MLQQPIAQSENEAEDSPPAYYSTVGEGENSQSIDLTADVGGRDHASDEVPYYSHPLPQNTSGADSSDGGGAVAVEMEHDSASRPPSYVSITA